MKYLRKYEDYTERDLSKWKIGSNVVCVKSVSDELTQNKLYKILDIENDMIEVENDNEYEEFYYHWKFASEDEYEESKNKPYESTSKVFGKLLEAEVQHIMDSIATYLEYVAPEKEKLDKVEYFDTTVDGVHEISFYYDDEFDADDDDFYDFKRIFDDFLEENNLKEDEYEFDDLMNQKGQLSRMLVLRTYASNKALLKLKKEAEFHEKTKKFNL